MCVRSKKLHLRVLLTLLFTFAGISTNSADTFSRSVKLSRTQKDTSETLSVNRR